MESDNTLTDDDFADIRLVVDANKEKNEIDKELGDVG